MPAREYTKKEHKETKEECKYSILGGEECLFSHARCNFIKNQEECGRYSPKTKEEKEAEERLKKECGHSRLSGECLFYNEMCYFENQEECPEYFPKYEVKKERVKIMIPPPDCRWKCPACGETQVSQFPEIGENPPKCPKCGTEMKGGPIKKGGPSLESQFKKY